MQRTDVTPTARASAPRRHLGRWIFASLSLLVLAGLAWGGDVAAHRVFELRDEANVARADLETARSALSATNLSQTTSASSTSASLDQACTAANNANSELATINQQVAPVQPAMTLAERLPILGPRVQAQSDTLTLGTQVASVGTILCQGLEPVSALLDKDSQGSGSTMDALRALIAARPSLLQADQQLQALQSSLNTTDTTQLDASNGNTIGTLKARLPQVEQTLSDGSALLGLIDNSTTHRYLLISQNPDELRATGGYIGSAGVLQVRNGQVQIVDYGSSRDYDTPSQYRVAPPDPFAPYLGSYWEFAGANWWPDFPTVAQQLEYFYNLSNPGQDVDGVIAVDQDALANFLQVLGPVQLPDYNETVDASDVEEKLDEHVHDYDTSEDTRKAYTAVLSQAVMQEAIQAPRSELPDLLHAAQDSLDQQHIQVWTKDQDAAALFQRNAWDGHLIQAPADYLQLSETEVATTKDSQKVSRTGTYQVDVSSPSAPTAHLALTYTNNASADTEPDGRFLPDYKTYLRVYAPQGATLVGSSGFDAPASTHVECGLAVFAGQITVTAGDSTLISLDYTLPGRVVTSSGYDLVVQQQPGVPPGSLQVEVTGANGTTADTSLDNTPGNDAHYTVNPNDATSLQSGPLPTASGDSCSEPIAQAVTLPTPVGIDVPGANISTNVVNIGIDPDGTMQVPPTPQVVGWYSMSARPGQIGNTVMAGHVDWGQNTAVFWGLKDLQPGDPILVHGSDGRTYTYLVQWNRTYDTDSAPLQDLIGGSTDTAEITLITCDGVFDHTAHEYLSRRFVRAVLAPS